DSTLSVPAPGVLANDTDPNGLPLTAVKVSNPTHGTVALQSSGALIYTVQAGYTGTDSFTYYATDGVYNSNTATVTFTIGNTAPAVSNQSYSVLHDQVLTVTPSTGVLANATDANNDTLTASLVTGSGPTHGTLALNTDGSFTYTPAAHYTGSDSFQFVA